MNKIFIKKCQSFSIELKQMLKMILRRKEKSDDEAYWRMEGRINGFTNDDFFMDIREIG